MRPLRLEVEGFTAFRRRTCLELGDLDLFAITGPTGAGKSSLIDAICYALYGRVPRVTNEVGACISQGIERMHVVLEFATGEERYRVYRETRRKGPPNARLERWCPEEGDWQALASGVSDVTSRTIAAVGLDYEGFTRSVLLPQGQFQEFLAGSPDKRRAVLGSLLRLDVYGRMQRRANAIAGELRTRLDERGQRLAALSDATPENLRALERELAKTRVDAERLAQEQQALAGGVEVATALVKAQSEAGGRETELSTLENEEDSARKLVAEGDCRVQALATEVSSLREQAAANAFDPDLLAGLMLASERAKALGDTGLALASAHRQQSERAKAAVEAQGKEESARARLQSSERERQRAEEAYREAQRHNAAAVLQQGLSAGDPCPVCGQAVGEMTPLVRPDLDASRKRYEAARTSEASAGQMLQAVASGAARAQADAESADRRVAELIEQRERQERALLTVLPEGMTTSAEVIERAVVEQKTAGAERQRLDAAESKASADLERLRAELQQAKTRLAGLEQQACAATQALASARERATNLECQLQELAIARAWADVSSALCSPKAAEELLRTRLRATQDARDQSTLTIGQMQERLKRLKEDIARARELRTEIEALEKGCAVSTDLAQMLQANRFQAFVQSEALSALAADGSRRLEALSAGRYRLSVEEKGQDFQVVDQWNADEARSVKTLSGGETFLASLALALALAESLPGLAASRRIVLDSIFLDEGFGALDSEALDRAADALDALRGENRMVCVVTHLPELAQRLPARVVVHKSEDGSSVEVA